MSTLNPADLKVGDIVHGTFEVQDGRVRAPHYALVVAEGARPVLVVGTSLKDSETKVRYGRTVFVVSPKTASQHWEKTGLVKPTLFDLLDNERVKLTAAEIEASAPQVVGTAVALLDGFVNRALRER